MVPYPTAFNAGGTVRSGRLAEPPVPRTVFGEVEVEPVAAHLEERRRAAQATAWLKTSRWEPVVTSRWNADLSAQSAKACPAWPMGRISRRRVAPGSGTAARSVTGWAAGEGLGTGLLMTEKSLVGWDGGLVLGLRRVRLSRSRVGGELVSRVNHCDLRDSRGRPS